MWLDFLLQAVYQTLGIVALHCLVCFHGIYVEPPKQCLSSLINNFKSMHNYDNKNKHCKQVIIGIHMNNNNIIIHSIVEKLITCPKHKLNKELS